MSISDSDSHSDADTERIGPVLGRIPSGVFILTASDGAGHDTGMLASWVQQASFEPPQATVAVNKSRYLHEWLKACPFVAINIVAENDKSLFKHFGRGFEPDEFAFEGVNTSRGDLGAMLLSDACGALEGRVVSEMESGDHVIYLVEIQNAQPGSDDAKPFVHIRRNGFSY